MKPYNKLISFVPTNIITGFLGAGKTSAILHFLKNKPHTERWAVLVNEFGEIGVDGSLLQGCYNQEQNVFIREVPGGCMCCAAGLPMQTALNQLLTRARPDRLLIEPTGLGHPIEVLQRLSSECYREVLSLEKVLTLVDARKLADNRYTQHKIFNQQIGIADIIIGNKLDLYQETDKSALEVYVKKQGNTAAQLIFSMHGSISPALLEGATAARIQNDDHDLPMEELTPEQIPIPVSERGYIKALNQGENFYSVGWQFPANQVFDRAKLSAFLSGIVADRVKAVFVTEDGFFAYNFASDTFTELKLNSCKESRIEIITTKINTKWEDQLMGCII